MIIHFIASKSHITSDINDYRLIMNTISEFGHILARDWVEKAYAFSMSGKNEDDLDWAKIHQENLEAIAKADLVIAEASRKSFSIGFQTALSIQSKKPTLVLTKNNALEGTFGSGINSEILQHKHYNKSNIRDILTDFFNTNEVSQKDLRFNFFIDRKIYNYLSWASMNTGKTKAEVVRELLQGEINKKT